jgi:hypothetical protein
MPFIRAVPCLAIISYGGLSRSSPMVATVAAMAMTEELNVPE